jgi:prevent-host-death family protein
MPSRTIPQRELRNNAGAILRAAQAGTTFTITVRGHAVAELGPVTGAERRTDVDRHTVRRILATPLDSEQLAADLDAAEAPLDGPGSHG